MILALGPLTANLAGCGSGNGGQLKVTLTSPGDPGRHYDPAKPDTYAKYKPGDEAHFKVKAVNTGPGSVTGVSIHVLLPPGFKYRSTEKIDAPGATRTQPVDAAVNSNAPVFGLWTLSAPGGAGAGADVAVAVSFIAEVEGQPGRVSVQAFASGDDTAGQAEAAPHLATVTPAAHLGALISVNPTSAKAGTMVTYAVRLTNDGTGNAQDVALLVTLPPVLTFASTVTPFAGNGTRNHGIDPLKNTLLVYYDGFLLPPLSNGGPGYVVVTFKALIVAGAVAGSYPVDASVTDDDGDTTALHAVAPLKVQ